MRFWAPLARGVFEILSFCKILSYFGTEFLKIPRVSSEFVNIDPIHLVCAGARGADQMYRLNLNFGL